MAMAVVTTWVSQFPSICTRLQGVGSALSLDRFESNSEYILDAVKKGGKSDVHALDTDSVHFIFVATVKIY
jgi:hypothetical protein